MPRPIWRALCVLLGACSHNALPVQAQPPSPGAPVPSDELPFFAVLDADFRSRHPALAYKLEALDRSGDADGVFTRSDALKSGALAPIPLVDLHVHPFMDKLFTWAFAGNLEPTSRITEDPSGVLRTQVTLPTLRRSGVNILLAAAYVPEGDSLGRGELETVLWQLRLMKEFVNRHGSEMAIARSVAEARAIALNGRIAVVPALEGGSAVQRVEDIDRLYRGGLRMMTVTHFWNNAMAGAAASSWSHPENFNYFTPTSETDGVTVNQQGLTDLGKAAVKRMARLGMVIDLAHSSDATIRDTLESVEVPVVVSHTAARALHGTERNVSDQWARAIAKRGGTIGVTAYRVALVTDGVPECRWFSAHFRHLLTVVGPDHIGLGSDFNGFAVRPRGCETAATGIERTGIRNVGDLPAQFQQLVDDGVPPAVIDRLGENSLRVFSVAEAAADPLAVREALALPEPSPERVPPF